MKRCVFLIFALIINLALSLRVPAFAQSPCASLGNPAAIVACEQDRQGGPGAMHASQPNHEQVTLTVLRQIAASLNAAGFPGGPFGVLVKTGGTNCNGYACDIICTGQGSGQKQWDVFGDVGGQSSPSFDGPLETIAVRPCEFVAGVPPTLPNPGPIPPNPGTPPVDLAPILARLEALENRINSVEADAKDVRAVVSAESKDIRSIIAALPKPEPLPIYKGSLWGIRIISRPCPECK